MESVKKIGYLTEHLSKIIADQITAIDNLTADLATEREQNIRNMTRLQEDGTRLVLENRELKNIIAEQRGFIAAIRQAVQERL